MLKESIASKKFKWIYHKGPSSNKVVALIPQYNELSKGNFIERLSHFNAFAKLHSNILDVILIDDGSNNSSLQVMKWFVNDNPGSFNVAAVTPNTDKIGALYMTVLNVDHDYVLFSDFDTDLEHLELLPETLKEFENDPQLMGCYFRMLPMKRSSSIVKYQEFEYAIHRKWYEYTSTEGSVAVMPGAGSLYKREILQQILPFHSGIRNGEDRETTAMGIDLGYKAIYQKRILAFTRTPESLKALIAQRVRWNLGYIETLSKEKRYYLRKIRSLTRIGFRSFFDIPSVLVLLLFPFIMLSLLVINFKIGLIAIAGAYLAKLAWVYFISKIGKSEIDSEKTPYLVLLSYPILKLFIEFPSWAIASYKFLITDYGSREAAKHPEQVDVNGQVSDVTIKSLHFQKKGVSAKNHKEEKTLN